MRARLLRCRPSSGRLLLVMLLAVAFVAYCYYYTSPGHKTSAKFPDVPSESEVSGNELMRTAYEPEALEYDDKKPERIEELPVEQCRVLTQSDADIDTVSTYPNFEFQPSWLRTREFWDKSFEDRYEKIRNDTSRNRLKVIVVPHSHNDPGWLRTFEAYFEWKTKEIITNMVQKLHQYPNMTFIWTEISFLNAWWERAHPIKQKALKKLIKEGRLEITTGGWVMPDEACTHIYSLIDQFIEGHLWVKNNLGIAPKTGWSIDPFGHGPTVPYLLDQSGLEGTIIQRIHYAWKQWLAQQQTEEFYWLPGWSAKEPSLIVHNHPFDIYSIKSTCGPHPSVCLSFDFRKIPGEYTEYSSKHEEITTENVHSKSKTLIEEYHRIGSLTQHNVVLVPLGDDFRYEHSIEFDGQYINYMKMFNYINSHKDLFNADVSFGTPLDFFNEVKTRQKSIPSLKGDFFVYSDIFSEGKPAYWSGYYTTRPYLKILSRELEHHLRTSEILFTLVLNYIKRSKQPRMVSSEKRLEKSYEQIINARRNLGLFQHHDAITGTSKASVMYDYGTKMFTSLYHCMRVQELALSAMLIPDENLHAQNVLQSEVEWETYGKPGRMLQISYVDRKKVVVFNPLMEPRTEIITVSSNVSNVRVYDTYHKNYPVYQITPMLEMQPDRKHVVAENAFDVLFVATLPPLTAITYNLDEHVNISSHCIVFCDDCITSKSSDFSSKKMMLGDIQLENKVLKLLVNRNTGFLRQIYRKDINKKNVVEMTFGAYRSAQRHSGAYLFMPDYDSPEKQVLGNYYDDSQSDNIIIVSGPVSTEIITIYYPFLIHTVKIYNIDDYVLSRGVYIETLVDFESPPKNRETELFMRIQTDIQNGEVPEFYTDQNGFQYQKRVKVDKLGIEGNYYPITTMAWLQDEESRLTLITNHAQGASAFEPGRLEVMLDRRTLYDDFRGLGEGVVDNKPTLFQNWLILEPVTDTNDPKERVFNKKDNTYQLPSPAADHLSRALNYPATVYIVDTSEVGDVEIKSGHKFATNLPSGLHLITLRTMTDDILEQFPSSTSLMVLQRPGRSCTVGKPLNYSMKFSKDSCFNGLKVRNLTAVSLTALKTYESLNSFKDINLDTMEVKTFKIEF